MKTYAIVGLGHRAYMYLNALTGDHAAGSRLIAEHLFPPASYMRQKYGLHSRALLPVAYVRRIVWGAAGWWKRG